MPVPSTLPPDAILSDAGEFGLISQLVAFFPQGEHVLVGPGDDAAVLRIKGGHVVVSTDLMVEGRTLPWAFSRDAVRDAGEDVLRLVPGS